METTDFVQDPVVELLFGAASHWNLADAHAVASLLVLAGEESAGSEKPLSETTGLDPDELAKFLADGFPGVPRERFGALGEGPLEISYEEDCLRRLLFRFSTGGSPLETNLSRILARRCLRANHLWQDLGLSSRDQLSDLMRRHFAPLAARNARNMKWKKFLYRMVCMDEQAGLCPAPTCGECGEFEKCFGEEPGLSLLARNASSALAG
jgi:nitrogen fixation protein NifQ